MAMQISQWELAVLETLWGGVGPPAAVVLYRPRRYYILYSCMYFIIDAHATSRAGDNIAGTGTPVQVQVPGYGGSPHEAPRSHREGTQCACRMPPPPRNEH